MRNLLENVSLAHWTAFVATVALVWNVYVNWPAHGDRVKRQASIAHKYIQKFASWLALGSLVAFYLSMPWPASKFDFGVFGVLSMMWIITFVSKGLERVYNVIIKNGENFSRAYTDQCADSQRLTSTEMCMLATSAALLKIAHDPAISQQTKAEVREKLSAFANRNKAD